MYGSTPSPTGHGTLASLLKKKKKKIMCIFHESNLKDPISEHTKNESRL